MRMSSFVYAGLALLLAGPAGAQTIRWRVKVTPPKPPEITIGTPEPGTVLGDIASTLGNAGTDVRIAAEKAASDASRALLVSGQQVTDATFKAQRDTWAELMRARVNLQEAAVVIGKYAEESVRGTGEIVDPTLVRFREGKIADALFHAATDPWLVQEEAVYNATARSSLVRATGGVAAGALGGPGGSAAFAAWQTYRATDGNMDVAVRAGIIAGLASAASSGVSGMEGETAMQVARKAALAGAIGGAAVAASGGGEDAVRDGFLWGGGMVIVQDFYRNYTGHPIDPRGATEPPLCISATDASCADLKAAFTTDASGRTVFDPSKLPGRASWMGIGSDPAKPPAFRPGEIPWTSDQSAFMRNAAKVPGMNAMSLFHDTWVVNWDMNALANKASIPPAIVLTYVGTGAELYDIIKDANVARARAAAGGSVSSGQLTVEGATAPTQGPRAIDSMAISSGEECSTLRRTNDGGIEEMKEFGVFCALHRYQSTHGLHKPIGDSLLRAGRVGHVHPGPAFEWVNPADSSSILVRLRASLLPAGRDSVRPAPGFDWVNWRDRTDFRTVYKPSGFLRDSATLMMALAPGWEWVEPQNLENVAVRLKEGLALAPNGGLIPAPGWAWVRPDDEKDLSVHRVPS